MQHKRYSGLNAWFSILLVVVCIFVSNRAIAGDTAGTTSPGSTEYPYGGMRRMDNVMITAADGNPWSVVIDAENGVAYYGTSADPGRVVKITLGSGANPPSYAGYRAMDSVEKDLQCGVMDTGNQVAYFGVNTGSFGRVVKLDLSLSYFPRVDGITLEGDLPRSAVLDKENGYAYFGTDTSPGYITKVDIDPDRSFVEIDNITLQTGEDKLLCAVIDSVKGYAYFGTYTMPGRVIKIALGSGNAAPTRVAAITLETGEDNLRSAVIDPIRGYAYFGTNTTPGKIVKVALGEGDNPPVRLGTLTLNSGEGGLFAAIADTTANLAWFGTYSNPARVVKVNLGDGSNTPTRVGTVSLTTNTEKNILSAAGDPEKGYAHFGTQQSLVARPIVRVALSQKSFIKGTKIILSESAAVNSVSLYSYVPVGNVRLAIYDAGNPHALLWKSGVLSNTMEQDWLTVPIGAGVPVSLELQAGNYYLAWQIDTNASVPGYIQGNTGDGFLVPFVWNDFPTTLEGTAAPVITDETWSVYLTYGMTEEGEGELPVEGEGEIPAEGEGETPVEGEGEVTVEGEGEIPSEGEGEATVEGEGEVTAEGEGETPSEGEGEVPVEGEGETPVEGEGETPSEGEGEAPVEGEGEDETPVEGEGETPVEGEGEVVVEGEGETPAEGEGETPDEGEGEVPLLFALEYTGPNPIYALSGDRVELTVTPVNSVGAIQYQWYHSALEKSFKPLPEALENTLLLVPVTKAQAGRYQCRATDAIGQAHSPEIIVRVDVKLTLFGTAALAAALLAFALSGIIAARTRPDRTSAPYS